MPRKEARSTDRPLVDPAQPLNPPVGDAAREPASLSPEPLEVSSPEAARQTIHQLRVRLAELEMQNEKLRTDHVAPAGDSRDCEERYRTLVEWSPEPIYVTRGGLLVYLNPAAVRLFGARSGRELVGTPIIDRVHPDFRDPARARLRHLAEGGAQVPMIEAKLLTVEGETLDVEIQGTAIVYDGVPAIHVAVHDMSASRRAEASLRASDDRWRTLFTILPMSISILHSDRRLEDFNPALASILSLDPEDLRAGTYEQRNYLRADGTPMPPEEFPSARAVREQRVIRSVEVGVVAGDGSVTWTEVSAAPLHPSELGCVVVTTDITERKQATATLAATAELLERAGALAKVGGWEIDLRASQVLWSRETCRIHEVEPPFAPSFEEALNFYAPEARPVIQAAVEAGIEHGTPWDLELPMITAKGRPIWVRAQGFVEMKDGSAVRLLGAFHDITKRRRAEEALVSSEAKLRAIIDVSPVPLGLSDAQDHITFLNPAFVRTFGYTLEDIPTLQDWWAQAFPDPQYREGVLDAWHAGLAQVKQTGAAFPTRELTLRCKDGTSKTAIANVASLASLTEDTFLISLYDLSALRQAEADMRLRSAALDATANTVVITDERGVIEWANVAFTTLTGYRADEAIGRKPGELLKSGRHDQAFYRDLWETISSGSVWRGEMVNRRKDGSLYTEDVTITPLKDAHDEITHFIAVKQDITQRKKLEEQFRQAQKLESVGRLAGGVAHDFNNMLGVILGHSDLAMLEVDPAHHIFSHLSEIHAAAQRSADLTRQLLAFARQQTIAPRVLDLNETVPGMLTMLQRLIGEDVQLRWRPAERLWPITMDPSQMDQILTNLCINARDAMTDIGTIAIATDNCIIDAAFCRTHADASPGDYVRLTVTDTGAGIEPEALAHIFEPFFTTKPVGMGTGLGLATVYGAVRQNLGFLQAASTPGQGSKFEIYLPRHVADLALQEAPEGAATAPRGTETVLLVEDEPALLALATRALKTQGYTVLGASGPSEALRLARGHAGEIHLLLTDVVMPEMNGRDLANVLGKLHPRLKHLFMSGYTANVIATHGVVEDEHYFIAKPFALAALAAKVRSVLDRE